MNKKTLEDLVRGELQKYLTGRSDFQGLLSDHKQKIILLQGECMKRLGENAVYNIDSQTCLDCAKTKCINDDACMALCTSVHTQIKLEEDILSSQAQYNELYVLSIFGIVALVISLMILFIFIVHRVNKYWISRTDVRESPDSDKVPKVLVENEEARTFIDTTAQQPLTENEQAV